ncbi:MAG TPA: hypothetical protein VFB73_01335 [Chloroflexota bacterium]|nr:hypothetical protein [Chloroflexota bacterium]
MVEYVQLLAALGSFGALVVGWLMLPASAGLPAPLESAQASPRPARAA